MKKLEDDSISKPKQYDHEERRVVQTGTITVLSKLTIKQNFNKKCDTTIKKIKAMACTKDRFKTQSKFKHVYTNFTKNI